MDRTGTAIIVKAVPIVSPAMIVRSTQNMWDSNEITPSTVVAAAKNTGPSVGGLGVVSGLTYPFRQNWRILHSMPKSPPRRGLSEGDLPLRLTVAAVGRERFHYVILRKDGTVLEASSLSYPSEVVARAAGLPELRRRSVAAK